MYKQVSGALRECRLSPNRGKPFNFVSPLFRGGKPPLTFPAIIVCPLPNSRTKGRRMCSRGRPKRCCERGLAEARQTRRTSMECRNGTPLASMTCSLPSGKETPGFRERSDRRGCAWMRWRRTDVSVRRAHGTGANPAAHAALVFRQISFRGRNFEARDRVDEGASAVNGAGRTRRTLSGT
ncbi:hypothetical protein FB004_101340 [Sinorhizobium medicae]|nr:hypothetical protein FB004_101340 [Sinorhizobium medicae]TWA30202.1 hypothetical protein FB006_101267 [Sinorhizobium medicae]TWA44563.1 hypothetical protein FB009_101315 [Sinorhizobium medicae]TWA48947.1 hypothetical protein FB005_101340 [Sinorhizobium medicae]